MDTNMDRDDLIILPNVNIIPPSTAILPPNLPGPGIEGKYDSSILLDVPVLPSVNTSVPSLLVNKKEEQESLAMTCLRHILVCIMPIFALHPENWLHSCRTIKEYEECVQYRFGKIVSPAKKAGFWFFIPAVDTYTIVDIREKTFNIQQNVLSRDMVTCTIEGVVFYKVVDAVKASVLVQNYETAITKLAECTLRSVVGTLLLDDILRNQKKVADAINILTSAYAESWGVDVTAVEIKAIQIPQTMERAMALQAESERVRIGSIISAEGDLESAQILRDAAENFTDGTLQLRYFQTMEKVSSVNSMTTVGPMPDKLLTTLASEFAFESFTNIFGNSGESSIEDKKNI